MATIREAITQLEILFDLFNRQYFSQELIKPVILIQSNGKHTTALGWCTTRKVWRDSLKDDFFFEITICAEHLDRGVYGVSNTLIHEMTHLKNLQNGVKDCSRSGTYHNKKFKDEAEQHGLSVGYHKKYGWAMTSLTDEACRYIDTLKHIDQEAFTISRQLPLSIAKPKSSSRKYICPDCGQSIRATKEVNIICGDCETTMIERRVES